MTENDPYTKAIDRRHEQNQFDIAVLLSVIVRQALSPRRTPKDLADLIDQAGGENELYKTSNIKGLAQTLRGGSLRPELTLIMGGLDQA